jgi:DNA polymerase III subunit delta
VKADRARFDQALKAPGATRFFLLHGPDESTSRALAQRVGAAMGPDAERIELSSAEIKGDPARLADEAAAISMFGGVRWILVSPAGEDVVPALEALADAPAGGNPVVLVAGSLRPTSRLLKLALADPNALALVSYLPDARNAPRLVAEMARERGLTAPSQVAARLAECCGIVRALIDEVLDKLALYLDASAARPAALEEDALEAVGADSDEGDLDSLVDIVLEGRLAELDGELARLRARGTEGISLVRPALLRRIALLARLRAEVDRGSNPAAVMASSGKAIFWKAQDSLKAQLSRWRSDLIAKLNSRVVAAQAQTMRPGGPGPIAIDAELYAICRQAARLR